MAEILKFIYLIILFISLFLVVTDVTAARVLVNCKDTIDCSRWFCKSPLVPKCISFKCKCVEIKVNSVDWAEFSL
ncbi:unnamed protein product [Trifolium pratense]|uniref:Uncharacterized protein n=1 Tax=Trifolium pratense TaxID=57577 RepID=A0ACB0KHM8_TRIPR|nr:unnamed protein product [Trifolium pratense]